MITSLSSQICVFAEPAWGAQAQVFCQENALQLFHRLDDLPTPYVLAYRETGLELLQTGKGAPGPISASFIQGKNAHRRQFGGGKGQLIAKAVGIKSGILPQVLDATAGLGRDAFVLATLGCQVTMLERSPVVAELLRSALEEASNSEVSDIAERMKLHRTNAVDWLKSTEQIADVVYLDPMYPERDKSALVKKEMRAFHDLVGPGEDDALLLEAALERARYRVVVKRPRKGVCIEGGTPSLQLAGKSSRYDIYTIRSMEQLRSEALQG